ncbi:Hypothetical protein R9X50_00776500 [Acrodontium crateriforme]|uniref:NAD-dependent protein deacetylase n=1 Tax=Acrodontium crateriforme TaxID=150365 RepID=A0AAQ3MCQ3_9PEZI|nr:Hypothetical protein R9X50_00776500 [Acrodontium crateriforme]
MGNEESAPIDESIAPETLTERTVDAVAAYLNSGIPSKIIVMTGAGISTSAGIPDFRSPDTGLYANLARLNLPYAEAVFDIDYFRQHPEPFYALAQELYPGKFRPTITHSFIKLLHDKGLLMKLFTQNIDCLEREAGVPGDKIIEAHGSFARQSCIECKTAYPATDIKAHIEAKTIPHCHDCKGLVKPDIVFFGEQLPREFFESQSLLSEADLCIIMGTSLSVQPFASLPHMVKRSTPRILINKERVGQIGSDPDDVLILGDCDDGVRKLAEKCGWLDDLETLWAQTSLPNGSALGKGAPVAAAPKTKDEILEDEIAKLTQDIDETLTLSKRHDETVRKETLSSSHTHPRNAVYENKDGNLSHVFLSASQDGNVSDKRQVKDLKKDKERD